MVFFHTSVTYVFGLIFKNLYRKKKEWKVRNYLEKFNKLD